MGLFPTDNALPISSWYCDPKDTALLDLLPFLDSMRFVRDVRTVLSRHKNITVPLKSPMKVTSFGSHSVSIFKYKVSDAEWATGLERAPHVGVQLKVWIEAPSLDRWLTPRP